MPPRKQPPKSLQELSLKSVARLTGKLCVNIKRKHGGWKCQASRDELKIWKIYLSPIPHVYDDDLWNEVFDLCFRPNLDYKFWLDPMLELRPKDKYLILELLMCDKVKTVDFSKLDDSNKCFTHSMFWKDQFLKLKNVVILDIRKVRLTDECFQAIGDVCKNVRMLSITSNLKHASMESLKHILKCQELRELRIDFHGWDDNGIKEYLKLLTTGLPKLEYFHDLLYLDSYPEWPFTKLASSMRTLKANLLNMDSPVLAEIFRRCTNLADLQLELGHHWASMIGWEKGKKVLKNLAKSSLELKSFTIVDFAFTRSVTRLIASRCTHLTSLDITNCGGKRISVNDFYLIGVSCPEIVELRCTDTNRDSEFWNSFVHANHPNMEEQNFVDPPPPMFVCLKILELRSSIDWDQRIVPLILRHADNLTNILLDGVFKPSDTSVDPLLQILDANALRELERLDINAVTYNGEINTTRLPIASIERLLNNCHKLLRFGVLCRMDDATIEYLTERERSMKSENFDIMLDFRRHSWTY